jgi:DNA-directed RNA polymerase II subunit RPB2
MADLITSKKELRYGINKLMELYFNQPNIIYQHLFSSYHQLIEDIIPYVLEKDIHNFYEHVDKTNLYIYGFEFKKTRILPPVRERDNEIIFPQMARKHYLNYFSNINVECRQVQEKIDLITGERTRRYIGDSEDVSIANIPVMVKSKYCATNLKPETSKYECKYDPGGYFIVGGQEKIVVCIEKMIDNKVLVFGKTDSSYASGKMYTAQINSRKHDWSENLQIIAIRNNKDDSISLTTSQFSEVPIFILIRALGVETDREIIARITNNLEDVRMINILRNSLEQSIDEEGKYIRTKEEAIHYLINKMKAGRKVSQTDEEVAKAQKKLLFEKIITKDFLPHLGTDVETKAAFICLMIKKLLLVMMGRIEEDDRDAFENKRVETPGVLIGQLFRQNLAKMLKNIGKLFRKKNNSDDTPINVVGQIKPTDIEQGIKSGLATGVWGMSKTKAGVAQSLSRLTWLQTISYLRRIKSPSMDTSTAKLTSIRQINNIQAFFVCNIETPEGQPIGLAKSLALMSTVTPNLQVQTDLVNELIEKHPKMNHPFRTNPEDIDNMIKVFHNGKWSSVINIKDGITFFDNLKQMRRIGKLSKMVSVTMDYIQKDLLIYTEAGRLIRPLLNVRDNRIHLTKKMVKDINSETTGEKKNMGWNNIMLKYPDLIDYEDIESSRNIMIAMDLEMLEDNKTNEDRKITSKESIIKPNRYTKNRYVKYTHSEFHPYIMLGTIVSTVPFINHNQAPRGIIYFSQAKQAMGVYSTAYKDRMDISNILYHPQIPLTTTKGMKYNRFLDLPSGENTIVAIMSYTGYNVEDSIIMNQTAIDRGLFRCDTVRKYNSKIEKNPSTSRDDMFMKPDRNKVTGMTRGNYEKLSDKGFIPEETEINNNDVLIGKVSPIQPTSDNKVYKDKSELFKTNVPGVVDRVHKDIFNADGYEMCSIRVRMEREPIIGDKFSNFHGQKGTVGITLPQMDMPFTKEGISPDIIFNPHGMPSRMTMGQLSETLSSKIAANTGALFDGTPFSDYDVMELPKMLKELGYNEYGTEEMYCGMTGRKMKAQVFIGPVYYLRLKHMVKDKIHGRSTGPRQAITRQPMEGRSKDGGLKIGEMEKDAMIAHGIGQYLKERMMETSDISKATVCDKCGLFATKVMDKDYYVCNNCNNHTEFSTVSLPYAFKLLAQELTAVNILPRIRTEKLDL